MKLMNNAFNTKKIISLLLAAALIISCFPFAVFGNAESADDGSVSIKAQVSGGSFKKGEVVSVKFYFEDYQGSGAEITTFQLDVPLDTEIFEFVSATCHLDTADTLASTTVLNKKENVIRTVYVNMKLGSALPADTKDICTVELKLIKDYEGEAVSYTLPVSQLVAINANVTPNIQYDCKAETPSFILKGSSYDGVSTPVTSVPEDNTAEPSETSTPAVPPPTPTAPDATPTAAVTASPEKKTFTVNYCDEYGRIFRKETVKEGDPAIETDGPDRAGYVFKEWKLSEGSLSSVDRTIYAVAVYERESKQYDVTVQGGTLHSGADNGKFYYDDCVIVSLDESAVPEGMVFAGWKKENCDTVISYSETYSFLITESVKLVAAYAEEKPSEEPIIVLDTKDVGFYVFTAERHCPADFSYVSSGIIFTEDAVTALDDEKFVIGAESVENVKSSLAAANGKFTVSKNGDLFEELYARAYMIYENAEGERVILYSDVKSAF